MNGYKAHAFSPIYCRILHALTACYVFPVTCLLSHARQRQGAAHTPPFPSLLLKAWLIWVHETRRINTGGWLDAPIALSHDCCQEGGGGGLWEKAEKKRSGQSWFGQCEASLKAKSAHQCSQFSKVGKLPIMEKSLRNRKRGSIARGQNFEVKWV